VAFRKSQTFQCDLVELKARLNSVPPLL
jgi:hypothetical protein